MSSAMYSISLCFRILKDHVDSEGMAEQTFQCMYIVRGSRQEINLDGSYSGPPRRPNQAGNGIVLI